MPSTLSHANSQLVSRSQLMTIPPPASTATWRPIAHGDLIQAVDRQLMVRGVTIRKEQFAVQRDGARLFAVLDLAIETTDDTCAAMGIRTANDRSMALEIAVGLKVFVCDNLAFSGDLIALSTDGNRAYLTVKPVPSGTDRLAEIDPRTGTIVRIIGDTGQQELYGLAYWGGKAYGFGGGGGVFALDMGTGGATPVSFAGATGVIWYGAGVTTAAPK